ncbi:MAG TPA: hypothetical protein VE130_16910 [Nitrososphaeraceae archaeon]|nr:hypothetical protein [Nitrososphaeraceae archaeon]
MSNVNIVVEKYVLNYHTGQTGIRIRKIIPANSQEAKSKPSGSSGPYATDNSATNESKNGGTRV